MTRIGIIGLGFMGRVHYDTYSKVSGAEVVAVCDADPKRAAGDLSDTWGNVDKGSTRQLPMERIKGRRLKIDSSAFWKQPWRYRGDFRRWWRLSSSSRQ